MVGIIEFDQLNIVLMIVVDLVLNILIHILHNFNSTNEREKYDVKC